jgi:hypothetical protein
MALGEIPNSKFQIPKKSQMTTAGVNRVGMAIFIREISLAFGHWDL